MIISQVTKTRKKPPREKLNTSFNFLCCFSTTHNLTQVLVCSIINTFKGTSMMIYTRTPKSKAKKLPKAKRDQYEQWLKSHQPTKKLILPKSSNVMIDYKLSVPAGRESIKHKSLDTGSVPALKADAKVYTGTKVLGIATMHKSNAVPVFNSEEAVQISNMRR